MAVALIDISVKVPKEINEVRDALVSIVRDIKAGKDLALVASDNIGKIFAAVDGVDKAGVELSEAREASVACLGLMASDLVGVLLPKAA